MHVKIHLEKKYKRTWTEHKLPMHHLGHIYSKELIPMMRKKDQVTCHRYQICIK